MQYALHKVDRNQSWINKLLQTESIRNLKLVARKGMYLCPYCSVPMHLRSGDIKGNYFAHPPNLACEKSRIIDSAYLKYEKQIKHESHRKRVLVSIVWDELNTANSENNKVEVSYGYLAAPFVKFFPDIYVRIGSKEWAVTIVSSITEAEDAVNAKKYEERNRYFLEKEMQPLLLIDRSNFAIEKRNNGIVLWETERVGSMVTKEDVNWTESIKEYANRDDFLKFSDYPKSISREDFDVKSVYYLSLSDDITTIRVMRYIEDVVDKPSRGLLLGEMYQIPLSQALQTEYESFRLSDSNTEKRLREEKKIAYLKWQEEQRIKLIKEQEIEKERLKTQREREEKNNKFEKQREVERLLAIEKMISIAEHGMKSSKQIDSIDGNQEKFTYKEITANDLFGNGPRPVDFTEREWNEHVRNGGLPWNKKRKNKEIDFQLQPVLSVSLVKGKYEIFEETLLQTLIKGEQYISMNSYEWRKLLLDWLDCRFEKQNWRISTKEIMEHLKKNGVIFREQESLVKYPLQEFLNVYQRDLKNFLKLNVAIIID